MTGQCCNDEDDLGYRATVHPIAALAAAKANTVGGS